MYGQKMSIRENAKSNTDNASDNNLSNINQARPGSIIRLPTHENQPRCKIILFNFLKIKLF